jgi:DNA polymerase I-like protein with 3'-5' exonuclease and polymerase domains
MPGVSEKELRALLAEGWTSDMIQYRLDFAAADSVLKYLKPLVGQDRVHPHYLPTQKSGRWSITNPPLANFSIGCIGPMCGRVGWHVARSTQTCWSLRDLVVPDAGWYFLKFDWNAIEPKIAAALSGDEEDLALFAMDADIHTIRMCRMFGFPLPPDLMNPHQAESCRQWRTDLQWDGKDDWRRVAGKVCGLGLCYAIGASGIHEARDVDELARAAGLDKKGLEAVAQKYLDSKPKLVAWKYQTFAQVMKTSQVRTFLGRRKRLFISENERSSWLSYRRPGDSCKQGLNHLAQGSVADIMNLTIHAIRRLWPAARLGYQSHDGLLTVWPVTVNPWPAIRNIVEKTWVINEYDVKLTATWSAVYDDGRKEDLN